MADALFPLRLLPTLPSFPWPAPLVPVAFPLPTEAESPGSGSAAQPTPELLLARAGPEPPHRRCPAQGATQKSLCSENAILVQIIPLARGIVCPQLPPCPNMGLLVSPVVHAPTHLSIPSAPPWHSGTAGRYQLVLVTYAPMRTVVWLMTRVNSVPLKLLRFMRALKCFAMSAPPLWAQDSSH